MHDRIIVSNNSVVLSEKEFNNVIELYQDKTSYEAMNTEIRINDYFENDISIYVAIFITLKVIDSWLKKIKEIDVESEFCFIISCDKNNVTFRFHKIRADESMWLSNDLNSYNQLVGYKIY